MQVATEVSETYDRLSVLGEGEHYDLHKPRNCTGSHLSLRRNTRIAAALTEAEDTLTDGSVTIFFLPLFVEKKLEGGQK